MNTTNAIECAVHSINEQQTKTYMSTAKGVAQLKNVVHANNTLQGQTFSGLERYDA